MLSRKNRERLRDLKAGLHPYVVFLPATEKNKILSAIFGSKAAVSILKFAIAQGVSKRIYQKDLVEKLSFSNKTIIETLKSLTQLGVLDENMEKARRKERVVWLKFFQLSDLGRWFALLLAEERDLPAKEKVEIFQSIFRRYVKWARGLAENLHVEKSSLQAIFEEEMK